MEYKERRAVPRYNSRVPCSVLSASTEAAILSHTEKLSLKAISLAIPSHPTYGADPSNVGVNVVLKLALPGGYVRLSGLLLRIDLANAIENLFVFKIEGATEVDRRLYHEHLDSLARGQDSPVTVT
jgi:hypothetical protein